MNPIFHEGKASYSVKIKGNNIRIRKFWSDKGQGRSKQTDRAEVIRLLNFLRMLKDGETLAGVGHRYTETYYRLFDATGEQNEQHK